MLMRFVDYNLSPANPTPAELAEERRIENCELLLDKVANGESVEGVTIDDVIDALEYDAIADLVALVLRGGEDLQFKLSRFRQNTIEKSIPIFSDFL